MAAFLQSKDRKKFENDIGSQIGCYLTMVVGGEDLYNIETDKVDIRQGTNQFQRLQRGEAAYFWCSCAGRIGRIYKINVKGQKAGLGSIPNSV